MIPGLDRLEVITLFVEDVATTRDFYRDVLGLKVIFEDDESAVVALQNLMINLLQASEADTLVEPEPAGGPDTAPRALYTIRVDDADAVCADLTAHGVKLLNGPIDRPWARRTAAFADPAGNVWEIAQVLPEA